MATIKREAPYNFDPVFEHRMVALACSNPRFYGRVAMSLDPEMLRSDSSKHAMRAAHAINKDVGHGPNASVLVIQRLRAWMADGKITIEAIKLVAEMFDDAEDAGLPDVESMVAEIAPLIQQRMRDEAVQSAIEAFGQKKDLSKAVEIEKKAARVGQTDTSVGTVMGPESWSEVSSMKDIERLSTGIVELDSVLDGGLQRGGLGVWVGGSGDGKSMALSHVVGVTLVDGAFCGYITLELPRAEVLARIKANMTGIPINALKGGDTAEAKAKLEALANRGPLIVQHMSAGSTTIEDIFEWVKQCEDFIGREMDLLCVDYGDKIGAKSKKGEGQLSDYKKGEVVFDGLHNWSDENKRFVWTASAATRRKDRKKRLDQDDIADSMHKIKSADLVVTLNVTEEGDEGERMLTPFVAKHRTGKSRIEVGPFPTAYEVGQIVPI